MRRLCPIVFAVVALGCSGSSSGPAGADTSADGGTRTGTVTDTASGGETLGAPSDAQRSGLQDLSERSERPEGAERPEGDTVQEADTARATDAIPATDTLMETDMATDTATVIDAVVVTPMDTVAELEVASGSTPLPPGLYGEAPPDALPLPDFVATSHDGSARGPDDLIGQPTVLWFFPFAGTPG